MPLHRVGAALLLLVACGSAADVPGFTRETGPDGREIVTYAAGLPAVEDTLVALFEIGKFIDDSSPTFEDLRDVEVGVDGRIYALDFKAREILVFDADGGRLTRVAGPGEGPGEISSANGMRFGPDNTLWINDHGKAMIMALNADGTERARLMRLVPGYGFRWAATIDTSGVMWEPWSQQLTGARSAMDAEGLLEGTSRRMYHSLDPSSGVRDSIMLDVTSFRSFVSRRQGGVVSGLPYAGRHRVTMDHHRRIWVSSPDAYALVRMNTSGDTTLELRVAEESLPITEADLARWRSGFAIWEDDSTAMVEELMPFMPSSMPLLAMMITDDADRLWVGRTVAAGDPPRWDLFTPGGEFLTTIRGPAEITSVLEPVVRGDRIYLLANGDAGERYIVVTELPKRLRGR